MDSTKSNQTSNKKTKKLVFSLCLPAAAAAIGTPAAIAAVQSDSAEDPAPVEGELATYSAFWDADYNYGQLLALAEEWGVDEFEAKERAGSAILDGDTAEIDRITEGIADVEYGEGDAD